MATSSIILQRDNLETVAPTVVNTPLRGTGEAVLTGGGWVLL